MVARLRIRSFGKFLRRGSQNAVVAFPGPSNCICRAEELYALKGDREGVRLLVVALSAARVCCVYTLARLFIMVETFVSLRAEPLAFTSYRLGCNRSRTCRSGIWMI